MSDRQAANLTVTGTGRVQAAPDEAVVHLSVITEARTAADAVAENGRRTQAVIEAVSSEPNRGVTTSGLSLYPIVNYEPGDTAGTIVGFRAHNSVEVTTKVEYVGQIYDAGIAAGANQSGGITFRIKDEAPYREEALRLAVEEAFKEARTVATAAGVELGAIESMQVEPGDRFVLFRSDAIDAKAEATPVIPERQTITARVNVQFRTREHADARQGHGKHERDGKEAGSRARARSHAHAARRPRA